MITTYLTKSLIYFIIIAASVCMLKAIHPDIKGSNHTNFGAIFKWTLLCLIPFLRAIVVLIFIILILIPEETFKKIKEKKEEEIMDNNTKSLNEEKLKLALLEEIERVEEIIDLYKTIQAGLFAATLMRIDINLAKNALMDENLDEMTAVYEKLKGWEM